VVWGHLGSLLPGEQFGGHLGSVEPAIKSKSEQRTRQEATSLPGVHLNCVVGLCVVVWGHLRSLDPNEQSGGQRWSVEPTVTFL